MNLILGTPKPEPPAESEPEPVEVESEPEPTPGGEVLLFERMRVSTRDEAVAREAMDEALAPIRKKYAIKKNLAQSS